MKALVISGGGSKGAFGGGIADYLMRGEKRDYDIFVGTSAGSLLVPLLAAGEVELAKECFTTVTQKDIFKRNPFIIKKRGKIFTTKINHFNSLKMFFKKQKTFGDSGNLRKLIDRFFLKQHYNKVRNTKKDLIVTVCNLTSHKTEYKSIHDCSYDDFCDWMWISANFVPFMSLVIKDGHEYADGGYGDYLPIHPAIDLGAKEVDAIFLRPEQLNINNMRATDPFDVLLRAFEFMLYKIGKDDIDISELAANKHNVLVRMYHAPRVLTENAFVFQPELMAEWWAEAYEYARTTPPKIFGDKV